MFASLFTINTHVTLQQLQNQTSWQYLDQLQSPTRKPMIYDIIYVYGRGQVKVIYVRPS